MKFWIDDIRDAPDDSWTVIRKVLPAIKAIANFGLAVTHISIDHDIEDRPDDETFMPIAYFIGEFYLLQSKHPVPQITIHSINPVGSEEMQKVFAQYGLESTRRPYLPDIVKLEQEMGMDLRRQDETYDVM